MYSVTPWMDQSYLAIWDSGTKLRSHRIVLPQNPPKNDLIRRKSLPKCRSHEPVSLSLSGWHVDLISLPSFLATRFNNADVRHPLRPLQHGKLSGMDRDSRKMLPSSHVPLKLTGWDTWVISWLAALLATKRPVSRFRICHIPPSTGMNLQWELAAATP